MKALITSVIFVFSYSSFAGACIQADQSVPIYKNAPTCCEGLEFEKPSTPNLGFSGRCVKSSQRNPSNIKQVVETVEKKMTLFQQPSL